MKKILLVLALCAFGGVVQAADSAIAASDIARYGDSTDAYSVRIGSLGGSGYLVVTGTGTFAVVNSPNILSGGKSSVTGSDGTGVFKMESFSRTSVGDTTVTNTFVNSYLTAPVVVWRNHAVDSPATNETTVASNQVTIVFGATNVTYSGIVFGR